MGGVVNDGKPCFEDVKGEGTWLLSGFMAL